MEMLHLAAIAEHERVEAGSVLTEETSPPYILVVLLGELGTPTSGGAPTVARRARR